MAFLPIFPQGIFYFAAASRVSSLAYKTYSEES